jgi:hypothetical protein
VSEYENHTFYFWEGGDCAKCATNDGQVFASAPDRPHPYCNCKITPVVGRVRKVGERRELEESHEEVEQLGPIPPGGSYAPQKNWSTTTTVTGNASLSAKISEVITLAGGGSVSSADAVGGAGTTTFNYDEEKGGAVQIAFAVYIVSKWRITTIWETHFTEGEIETFETFEYEETRTFDRYEQEAF